MYNSSIRQVLAKYGLKQRDLARLLNVSEAWISKMLNASEISKEKQLMIITIIEGSEKDDENR